MLKASPQKQQEEFSGFQISPGLFATWSGKVMSDWALFRFCTGHTQNYFAYPKATISMFDLLSVLAFGPWVTVYRRCQTLICDPALLMLQTSMREHKFLRSQICATHVCRWPSKFIWHHMKLNGSLFFPVRIFFYSLYYLQTAVLCYYHFYLWSII